MRVSTLKHIESAGKSLGGYMRVHQLENSSVHKQAQYHLRKAYNLLKGAGAK